MFRFLFVLCPLLIFSAIAIAENPVDEARQWIADHKESGLVLVHQSDEVGFDGQAIAGAKSSMHVFSADGFYVNLGFDGVLTKESTLADVRKAFKYVALDKLPTPGLEVEGWEIKPRTPVSSFKKGVEILDYRDGRIVLRVKTEFFALYGRDARVELPADAPSPKGTYFQVREKFKLDLTISAPFALVE